MKKRKREKEEDRSRQKKTDAISEAFRIEYSSLDACVCCGRYMPEGTGMVCEECKKDIFYKENGKKLTM